MAIGDHYGREQDEIAPFEESPRLRTGLSAGFLATLVSGLVIALSEPALLTSTIPGMYGLESALVVGVGAHLVHGAVFGLAFAVILSDPQLVSITNSLSKTTIAGVVYGMVLAVVGTGIIMPVWLTAVGVVSVSTIPYFTTGLIAMHAVYGLALGALFPFLEGL